MKILKSLLVIILFLFFIEPSITKAQTNTPNQFINIVNPVRISTYTKDPASSLEAEYEEIRKRNLPATWLLNYDVLSKEDLVSFTKQMDKGQELGIFVEITPRLAEESKVVYNKTDSWHRANSVFLSGYLQEDRKKMIDTLFAKFKEAFGYYPVSVGSWWNDSFSLQYMKEKYGITANLTCADQFLTDGYHIWGQYWGAPYYPSKYHTGIPAGLNSKLDLVNIQWAPRDPLKGYHSSLYSTQDYFTLPLNFDYFEKLISLYAEKHNNSFGQITVGLEGDLDATSYKGIYASQMQLISDLQKSGDFRVVTMKQFSNWYREEFKEGTPDYLIESEGLLNEDQKAIWYQSQNYRLGVVFDNKKSNLELIDLRTYSGNFQEPYYLSPNFGLDLFINIPSVIDSISNPQSKWEITNVKLISVERKQESVNLNFEGGKTIKLKPDAITLEGFTNLKIPSIVKNSPKLDFKENKNAITIYPKFSSTLNQGSFVFPDLSVKSTYFFMRPKVRLAGIGIGLIIAAITLLIFFLKKKRVFKYKLLMIVYFPLLTVPVIYSLVNIQLYSVNQQELDALEYLSALPAGKVAVKNNACLICKWKTKYPPPAFANKKDYVGWFGHKSLIYNTKLFETVSREEGRKEIAKIGAKYFYLVKYEGYTEEMPFSPGDLNVEKIFENANAQIWKLKDS